MRKGLRKLVAIVLTAAMALSIGTPAFAATNTDEMQSNVNKELYITETTTLGEIIRHTEPEKYVQMPDEMKEKFNATNALDYFKASEANATSVASTQATRGIEIITGSLVVTTSAVTTNSFFYNSTVMMTAECPYIFLETIIYEYDTGKIVDSDSTNEFDSTTANVNGTVSGLKSGRAYKVVAFGDVIYPEGFVGDSIGSQTKYVYTK